MSKNFFVRSFNDGVFLMTVRDDSRMPSDLKVRVDGFHKIIDKLLAVVGFNRYWRSVRAEVMYYSRYGFFRRQCLKRVKLYPSGEAVYDYEDMLVSFVIFLTNLQRVDVYQLVWYSC
jgi:hypothetical protein